MSVDKINRREQEQSAALGQPPLIYDIPRSALDFARNIYDSITSVVGLNRAQKGLSRPILDEPSPLDLATFAKGRKGIEKLLQPNVEPEENYDVDSKFHGMLLKVIEENTFKLGVNRNYFEMERAYSESKEQERSQEILKQVKSGKSASKWGSVEKSLISFGLIAAGCAACATGFVPLGVTAIVIGTLFAVDQLLDDVAKKTVSTWIARGDKELEQVWLDRIELGCALISLGLSLGISAKVSADIGIAAAAKYGSQLGLGVANATAGGVKNYYQWLNSTQKAMLLQLDFACTTAQKSVNRIVSEIQEICNTLYQLYENMHHIEEQLEKLARSMLHRPN